MGISALEQGKEKPLPADVINWYREQQERKPPVQVPFSDYVDDRLPPPGWRDGADRPSNNSQITETVLKM